MNTPPTHDDSALRDRIAALVEDGDLAGLEPLVAEMHASDVADVVEALPEDERVALLRILPADLAGDALVEMEGSEGAAELLTAFGPEKRVELIGELEVDDAADLVGELEPAEREKVLSELPVEDAVEIRDLLRHDEETAGGIMDTHLVSIPEHLTAGQAIEEVRFQGREVEDFFTVFVVDTQNRLLGTVRLDDLVLADLEEPVASLVEAAPSTIQVDEDQEEAGKRIGRYNLPALAVLDEEGRLCGRITFDDVLDVIEAEQTEDLLRFSGVSDEEELRGGWGDAVRSRLPWLLLHSVTLSIASSVILLYEHIVEQAAIIVFTMPIIAGLGGNAGTQALAVTVRRLATESGDLEPKRAVVGKEVGVALFNGLMVAIAVSMIVALIPVLMPDVALETATPLQIGGVVLAAMWGNVLVAGSAGAIIPTVLNRLGADPAVASSVFLTTLTDLIGFFLLLGLASAVLL